VQVHYDEGVGAARLAAILAGESPSAEESSHCCSHIQQRVHLVESLEVKAPVGREGGQIRTGGRAIWQAVANV
jgi:hypothetical protein